MGNGEITISFKLHMTINEINPLVVFGLLSLSLCSRSKMTGLQTTAYKSVIMLYYH